MALAFWPSLCPPYAQRLKQASQLKANATVAERFLADFSGHFTNKAQADTSSLPMFREQETICQRIWEKRFPKDYWLHFAWFAPDFYQKPLTQVLFKIEGGQGDTFNLLMYNLPDVLDKNYHNGQAFDKKPLEKNFPFQTFLNQPYCKAQVYYDQNQELWLMQGQETCYLTAADPITYLDVDFSIGKNYTLFSSTFYNEAKQIIFDYKGPNRGVFQRIDLTESIKKTQGKSK